ncbi:hypothetical protein ACHAWF_016337 [Thalassiosira exigua]
MGVSGLLRLVRELGLDGAGEGVRDDSAPPPPGPSSTLAVDGDGLAFHLFRTAYRRRRREVLALSAESAEAAGANNDAEGRRRDALTSQLLLPNLVPLSVLHEVTTSYLADLTDKHGMKLRIFFDGPDQKMKAKTRSERRGRREDEWENVRQLIINGTLPDDGSGGNKGSKFRSEARRQSREYRRRSGAAGGGLAGAKGGGGDDEGGDGKCNDDEEEMERFLASFPLSPLALRQVECSIRAFADALPDSMAEVIDCNGEADAAVALASALDPAGNTYVVANDTDYLIYGNVELPGEVKYVQFHQINPSKESAFVGGTVLTQSAVAEALGLPLPGAMVEMSILMGNDYTGPYLRVDDPGTRRKNRDSLRWVRGEGGDEGEEKERQKLPGVRELDFYDSRDLADHVAEMVGEGWRLSSEDSTLSMAIEFSYALYSFGDVSAFPSDVEDEEGDAEDGGDDEGVGGRGVSSEEGATEDVSEPADVCDGGESEASDEDDGGAVFFPSLPRKLDLSLARAMHVPDDASICDAALLPLRSYINEVSDGPNDVEYVQLEHLSAFQETCERVRLNQLRGANLPLLKLRWRDVQALNVLERCLASALDGRESAEDMPCRVFDRLVFLSILGESLLDDYPLDNEIVSKDERAFQEEIEAMLPPPDDEDDNCDSGGETAKPLVLPIDEHKDEILSAIATQRVTIIHGETGCGKSSRVPCFLLRAGPPEPSHMAPEVKMMVSQPRRIAAKALAERVRSCEPDIAEKIGLRMGHGVREHETSKTRAWFVTTGYVVRLLANYPGWFDSHTHLIIDEVHERSVDTDILCLLCRRLLHSHPTIRLVLMSATMAAELYSQYFGSPQPPIHVGARRFPIKEYFVEDLTSALALSPKSAKLAQGVFDECEKNRCNSAPSSQGMDKRYYLATQIAASVGSHGSSVLIFVPGMSDIEAIIEQIEKLDVPYVTFVCLPIHSDVPFEEQMMAFEPPKEGEVKVIVATNAAESSLTLPDVDHVVCLGLCKQIVYNRASHRQMLVPTWISRASATQRAGRTGRVREGNVYRLYSRNTFHKYMPPFEAGEMVRVPLDNVILSLRNMLNEEVTPILLDCLEPPDISNIERSFQSLHESNFISDPTDDGKITSLGSLVVALGIDLTLGAFVGLGIQFGVAAEAIIIAAILSFPKTPWMITSPLYHEHDQFNDIVSKTFASRCHFDGGLFSEPLATANLLYDYASSKSRGNFCWKHGISASRMKNLHSTAESLKRRVANYVNLPSEVLEMKEPPYLMPNAKVNILRILQVWLFHETMIVQTASKRKIKCVDGSMELPLEGPPIGRDHLVQIFDPDRHPFEIRSTGKIVKQGHFDAEYLFDYRTDYFDSFEIRFTSYALEKHVDMSFYFVDNSLKIIIPEDIWDSDSKLRETIIGKISVTIKQMCYLQNTGSGNQRGRRGRACGAWHTSSAHSALALEEYGTPPMKKVCVLSSGYLSKKQLKEFKKYIESFGSIRSILSCTMAIAKLVNFSVVSSGECQEVSAADLSDLFAAPAPGLAVTPNNLSTLRQSVYFPPTETDSDAEDARNLPLVKDAPEGARLMMILASERRRENFIRFSNNPDRQSDDVDDDDEQFVDVNLPKKFAIVNRWAQKSGGMVFVPENCVPAAVIPTGDALDLFACCANTLDLRGGARRVDGITMLPPGRLFVGLALLCFGINPKTGLSFSLHDCTFEEKKEVGELDLAHEALSWIYEKDRLSPFEQEQWRIMEALNFHTACMEIGETLECQPDKIQALCRIFDGVRGHDMIVWDDFELSLNAMAASLRPKPLEKAIKRRKSKSRVDRPQHPHDTNDNVVPGKKQPTPADSNISQSQSAEPTALESEGCPQPSELSKSIAKTTAMKSSQRTFACLKCRSIFSKWTECLNHRGECCPNIKFSMKKSVALAKSLEGDDSASFLPARAMADNVKAPNLSHDGNAKAGETHLPKIASKEMWVCLSCKETFQRKGQCLEHIRKCSFGLVKETQPKLMLVCNRCKEMFEDKKLFKAHKPRCSSSSTAKDGCELKYEKIEPSRIGHSGASDAKASKAKRGKPVYGCKSCAKEFSTWKPCLEHMVSCNLGDLAEISAEQFIPEHFVVRRK